MFINSKLIAIVLIVVSFGVASKSIGDFRAMKIARSQPQLLAHRRSRILSANSSFSEPIEIRLPTAMIVENGRGHGGGGGGGGGGKKPKRRRNLLQRILPMFLVPFLVQSAILPIILSGMKFMLLKSLTIGKIALILMLINIVRRNDYSDSEIKHYGYSGNDEYGAYVN